MKLVWELGRPRVRDVYEALRASRPVAYTTVMTMLNVLVDKGRLRKRREDRSYVYEPTQARGDVIRSMVREFVERVFDGSAKPLVAQLAEDKKLSPRDLDEIRDLLKRAEEEE